MSSSSSTVLEGELEGNHLDMEQPSLARRGGTSKSNPANSNNCQILIVALACVIIGGAIGTGVALALIKKTVSQESTFETVSQESSFEETHTDEDLTVDSVDFAEESIFEETSPDEDPIVDSVTFVNVGCYESETSLDIHRLSYSNLKNRAYECSQVCVTRFFGVTEDICNCFVDIPEKRLAIGSCEFVEDTSVSTMELYFDENINVGCSQQETETVRNFLVEEDDAPFGFDIVSNKFRLSPFELFKDECGTNIYEVQTEVSEGSQSLQTTMAEVKEYAKSIRSERVSSLSASASASYNSMLFSASMEVSASSDSEQINVFKSSGANEEEAKVFTSLGVKRLAEVKILDFDNTNRFVTLSRSFGNLLRSYIQSDFDKATAYEIIQKYGQFVLTRGIFGGYMQLRTTMSGIDVSESFDNEESAKDCFEASVSGEAEGFGFSGKASVEGSTCNSGNKENFQMSRSQFNREVSEETVVGGRREGDEFIVDAQSSTLLTTIDKYPAGDVQGVQFRLLSDFLGSDKISPLEVKRLQITEDEFDGIQSNLQEHILEYLRETSDIIGGCNCADKALPYLEENEDGQQECFCYDPTDPVYSKAIILHDTWSKTGNRRTCAWDRCPSSNFYWQIADSSCNCVGGLNDCYFEGPPTTVEEFFEANLSPVAGFDPSSPETAIYKLTGYGSNLELGQGGDCASGGKCYDDPLRGGFQVNLEDSGYEFVGTSKVTHEGWSRRMLVKADGVVIEDVLDGDEVYIPSGAKLLEVLCGGWCGSCSSELFVRRNLQP